MEITTNAEQQQAATAANADVSAKRNLYGKFPPRVSLRSAVKYTDELVKVGGATGTKDDLSKAVSTSNTTSGAYTSRVLALKNFGLISTDRKTYRLEDLGVHLTSGIEDARKEAIRKAFLSIPTAKKIWEIYKGGILPPRESLGNALVARLPDDVPKEYKDEWAKFFYEGAEFAGMLDKRSSGWYLAAAEPTVSGGGGFTSAPADHVRRDLPATQTAPVQTFFSAPSDTITFSKILSTQRLMTLTIPEDPTPQEASEIVQRIKQVMKAMKGFMDDDSQP